MLEVVDLTKHYGDVRAVDGITFTAQPGVVTGFLGDIIFSIADRPDIRVVVQAAV